MFWVRTNYVSSSLSIIPSSELLEEVSTCSCFFPFNRGKKKETIKEVVLSEWEARSYS